MSARFPMITAPLRFHSIRFASTISVYATASIFPPDVHGFVREGRSGVFTSDGYSHFKKCANKGWYR